MNHIRNSSFNPDLIFVGGSPRSGTTLLQRILNCHSEIYGGPELDLISEIIGLHLNFDEKTKNGRSSNYLNKEKNKSLIKNLIKDILSSKAIEKKVKIISEKTPSNSIYFSHLLEIFDDIKLILIIRDPRAIVSSMLEVGKIHKKKNLNPPYFCINSYQAIKEMNRHIQPTLSLLEDPRLLVIYYEDLVDKPELTVKKICDFLKIKFEKEMTQIDQNTFDYAKTGVNEWVSEINKKNNINVKSKMIWKKNLSKIDEIVIGNNMLRNKIFEKYNINDYKLKTIFNLIFIFYSFYQKIYYRLIKKFIID